MLSFDITAVCTQYKQQQKKVFKASAMTGLQAILEAMQEAQVNVDGVTIDRAYMPQDRVFCTYARAVEAYEDAA